MPSDEAVKYQQNDRVTVMVGSPAGHFRTPTYIQGHTGRVVALCGVFPNPESVAHGGSGLPKLPLYRVEFDQKDIWPEYEGPVQDKVLVDVYQHWLEPATA